GPGNQTAPPAFVDRAAGDFREAAGSPTIDAGASDPLDGELDFAGNPRVLGPAPDIGAYEFPPPKAPSTPVAQIQSLAIAPKAFPAANLGGAIVSKKKAKAPVGADVSFGLSAAAAVQFTVEQLTTGRKAGKKCVKQTAANKGKAKCTLVKELKG